MREKTVEEVRCEFVDKVGDLVDYWSYQEGMSDKDKVEGVAFSILTMLDGCSLDMPGFIVAPLPHEDDKEYDIENGENYYPQNHNSNVKCDIAGVLHYTFSARRNK